MQFDTSSPIWMQLVTEFTRRIAVGQWQPGQKIPGVRELAAELEVNPNTVQRALAELERNVLCYTQRATGRFVTEDEGRVRKLREASGIEITDEYISKLRGLAIELDQARDLLTKRWKAKHD